MSISVVFLTHNYPRRPGDLAGAFLETLAATLVQRNIQVSVVVPSDGGAGGEVTGPDGVRVRRVRYATPAQERIAYGGMADATRSVSGMIALVRMIRALRRAAREEIARGADLLHAHWWFPAGLAAPAGAPLVVTSHGSDAALLARSPVARALAKPVYRRAAVVTAVSSELARWIETGVGRRLGAGDIQPMPVEVERFIPTSGGSGAVVVGRLVAQKRVHLAIEAIALLQARGVAMPLTIIGDGPERTTLERFAHELGVANTVRFTGACSPDRVPSLLATADLMLFPARAEGFGLAAAEAFLAGVPVIACRDGGGVLDIVPEAGAGRRVAPTADALAAAMLDLVQSGSAAADLPYRRALWRERLNADTVAAACEGWYHAALASPKAA